MAASSRSEGSGRAAAGSLESLSNPQLNSLPAAELVVRLYSERRGSEFAEVALVLATRERSAADAEARIRAADEVAGRLREEIAARALESEARIRRAAKTEARLRDEIRALERRADEAGARARLAGSSDTSGRHRAVASEDGRAGIELETVEIESELGAEGPAAASEVDGADDVEPELGAEDPAAASEVDGADDVDPDDALTLNQYLKKRKLMRRDGCFLSAESGDDAWENARALAVIPSQEALAPVPLAVILPGNDLSSSEVDGIIGDDSTSDTESSPVAMHSSEAEGATLEPSNSAVPPRASNDMPREKGMFYNMVLEALKEKEKKTFAKAAASQQPNLRCWLYAPLPSESVDVEEDPRGKAPQK